MQRKHTSPAVMLAVACLWAASTSHAQHLSGNRAIISSLRLLSDSLNYFRHHDELLIPTAITGRKNNTVIIIMKQGASVAILQQLAKTHLTSLQIIANVIAVTLSQRFKDVPFNKRQTMKPPINPKPLKLLETLANKDYTLLQVADHLNISIVTANKQLSIVRTTLCVKTNLAAIKKALQMGYISYD